MKRIVIAINKINFGQVSLAEFETNLAIVEKPNVVHMIEAFSIKDDMKGVDPKSFKGVMSTVGVSCFVLKKYSQNVYDYCFNTKQEVTLDLKLAIAYKIAFSLNELHKINVLHRDLKVSNIIS